MDLRKRKLLLSCGLFLFAVLDIISDWYVFSAFLRYSRSRNDQQLTLGIICGLSTILFGVELFNIIRVVRVYRNSSGCASPTPEEQSLQTWSEVVTFFQTVVEDFPITLVMYLTFRQSSCALFLRTFERSFAGNIALLAAFLSSFSKMITAFFYCCTGYMGLKCGRKGFCFVCRIVRALCAILLMAFTAYLFVILLKEGTKFRPECHPQ